MEFSRQNASISSVSSAKFEAMTNWTLCAPFFRKFLGGHHFVADQVKVQQRLTALELDLDRLRRSRKSYVECPHCRLFAHVIPITIGGSARDLTIRARVLATERHHKDMKGRRFTEKGHSASQSKGQQLQLRLLAPSRNHHAGVCPLVKPLPGDEI